MNDTRPVTAASFRRRIIGLSYVFSAPAALIIISVLLALLDMTADERWWFAVSTLTYAIVFTPPLGIYQKRLVAPVCRYLDERAAGEVAAEVREDAFRSVMRLPLDNGVFSGVNWVIPSGLVASAMAIRFDSFGGYEFSVTLLSGIAAGCFAGSFINPLTKRIAEPVREMLAEEISNPLRRGELVQRHRLGTKMLLAMSTTTLVPVVFAVLLLQSEVTRTLHEAGLRWQRGVVAGVDERLPELELAAAVRAVMGDAGEFEVVLLALDEPNDGRILDPEVFDHVRQQVESGADRGDSAGLRTERSFAWVLQSDDRILISTSSGAGLGLETANLWLIFGVLMLVSTGICAALSYLLSSDVSRTAMALRINADRMASGDLRRARPVESEDELGDLARSFETMGDSLRETVRRVMETADRVDTAAVDMAAVSESVSAVTADQVLGIQHTTTSMESINEQVRGIADSSQALNASVEESSSSVLELGAANEELNETASVLSSRVSEVSGSIEEMIQSVKQVSQTAESLTEAAVETSASMEEMANSLREVDDSAEETARLSRQVVEIAETGQEKVSQTIAGMEAIREATEVAERVIRSLGGRTKEIGAIVDVIDDVADETNLLALNAAIIAAQAGEHGRAFSVVADEIKDLADRVLASTKEIGGLIRSVQSEANDAIGAVERGSESVASGVDLSAEAGVSLEEITRASRESGLRISGIVSAVREQAKAAAHVFELMERVRAGVDEIRSAALEQDRGNEVVYRSAVAMRDVAHQVRGTTEEQAHGSRRIRESVEGVQEAVEQINSSLQEQSAGCRSAVEFLEEMHARTRSNEESTRRMNEVKTSLVAQSEALREEVRRFRV